MLDLEVISKTCGMCSQEESSLTEDQFEQWFQTHHCEGSYNGSSPSTEMECVKGCGEEVSRTLSVTSE